MACGPWRETFQLPTYLYIMIMLILLNIIIVITRDFDNYRERKISLCHKYNNPVPILYIIIIVYVVKCLINQSSSDSINHRLRTKFKRIFTHSAAWINIWIFNAAAVDINNNLGRDHNHDTVIRSGCTLVHYCLTYTCIPYTIYLCIKHVTNNCKSYSPRSSKRRARTIEWRHNNIHIS